MPYLKQLCFNTSCMQIQTGGGGGGGLAHLSDGSSDGSLLSNLAFQEDSSYTIGHGAVSLGSGTFTEGDNSFAIGYEAGAYGDNSVAMGEGTISDNPHQVALGKYNTPDSNNEFVLMLGNGSDYYTTSDAMDVTWDGDIYLAIDTTAASGTVDGDLYASITRLGWDDTYANGGVLVGR